MALDITGKLHKKFDTEQKTDSFKAREFVIETEGEYPQFVKFQIVQDRCALIDNFEEGQNLKVHFDLRGREWQGKYFTNLNAWKIEAEGAASNNANNQAAPQESFNQESSSSNNVNVNIDSREDLDDLPF